MGFGGRTRAGLAVALDTLMDLCYSLMHGIPGDRRDVPLKAWKIEDRRQGEACRNGEGCPLHDSLSHPS